MAILQNKLGDTPLHNAAWKGHADIVEALLERGQSNVALFETTDSHPVPSSSNVHAVSEILLDGCACDHHVISCDIMNSRAGQYLTISMT